MKTVKFGTQTFCYNQKTLVIEPAIEYNSYKVLSKECSEKSTFANGDVIYSFDNEGAINCIIATNGDSYVGDYIGTTSAYINDDDIELVSCE